MNTIDTVADIEAGMAALVSAEPRFAGVLAVTGTPPLRRAPGGYAGLLRIITEQQLSLASAQAIWRRMERRLAPFEPRRIARRREATLIGVGLSRAKVRAVRALTAAILEGSLDCDRLHELADDAVAAALTRVRGIGPWTAEIYLLSSLGRRDVWPAGDLALQVGAERAFALACRPDTKAMQALAEPWRPWRAVAARLLWAYYRASRGERRQ